MKKLFVVFLAVAFVALFASGSFAGIKDSKHDLRSTAGGGGLKAGDDEAEICKFCHTPHNPILTGVGAPLWNRSSDTAGGYTMYSSTVSSTFSATQTNSSPQGVSKLCLSCHDGSLAIDAYGVGGVIRATADDFLTTADSGYLSKDLSASHPVSFTYDANLVNGDGELNDPTSLTYGVLFGASSDQVECASCHDVHDGDADYFLISGDNDASKLCLDCHAK